MKITFEDWVANTERLRNAVLGKKKLKDINLRACESEKLSFQNIPQPNIELKLSKPTNKEVKAFSLNNVNFNKINELQEEINKQKFENSKLLINPICYNKTRIWTVLPYIIIRIIILALLLTHLWPTYLKKKITRNGTLFRSQKLLKFICLAKDAI